MAQADSNGIRLEYEVMGPDDGRPLLLVHGVGAQLIRWPVRLCQMFADAGFRVIRFDNRDVGLSTHMNGAPVPDLAEVISMQQNGETPALPYTLSDMAADAAGLLDALDIESAHLLGVSLGGMIAQVLAIEHPHRVRSLNVMMSQSGDPDLPASDPAAVTALSTPAPHPGKDREAYIRHSIKLNRVLGSPAYPADETELRAFAERAADRAYNPAGGGRHMAAARGAPDRRASLQALSIPTLVIHGVDDPLIPVAAGREVARNVKAAWLLEIGGMGHDLPSELFDLFVSTVKANSQRTHSAGTSDPG